MRTKDRMSSSEWGIENEAGLVPSAFLSVVVAMDADFAPLFFARLLAPLLALLFAFAGALLPSSLRVAELRRVRVGCVFVSVLAFDRIRRRLGAGADLLC